MPEWERLLAGSRAVATVWWAQEQLAKPDRALRTAAATSRTTSGFGTAGRWVRASWLYRWLTAEPDSREIVIDLRRSYAVGWLLELGERSMGVLDRATSRAASNRFLQHAAAHPVRLAGAALLGAVLASLVRAWPVSDPLVLGFYGFAVCVSGLTLAVEDWRVAAANSRTSTLLAVASRPVRARR